MRLFLRSAWQVIICLLIFSFPHLVFSSENIEEARARAEEYARKSLEARKKPPRELSPQEQKAEELIKQADVIIAQAETPEQVEPAIKLYQQAIQTAPNYDKAWWGLGMSQWTKAVLMPQQNRKEKQAVLKLLEDAEKSCKKALEIDPMSPGANYWLSNIFLSQAGLKGMIRGAFILPRVFKLSDKVAEVDPYYGHGAIFRTYGIVLMVVPDWLSRRFGYTPEIILPYLDKAIKLEPNCFANYLVRAGIYLKLGGEENKEKALKDLDYVLTHNPELLEGYQADNRRRQKEARQIWKQITGKEYPQR